MMEEEKELELLITLKMSQHLGDVRIKKLLDMFKSASNIFSTPTSKLSGSYGMSENLAEELKQKKFLPQAKKEIEKAKEKNVEILPITSTSYPYRLKQIHEAPVLLSSKGNFNYEAKKVVAIVGSRTPTEYGKYVVKEIINYLTQFQDILIVSGLAYGIDITVHKYCIEKDIPNVAVLGSGIENIYPSTHTDIAEKMMKNGGLISERMLYDRPHKRYFPKRNRIIAGLSDLVIVAQAGQRSGANITAYFAVDMNREVMAVPGRWTDPYSQGCNHLISKNYAHLLKQPEDIGAIMEWIGEQNIVPKKTPSPILTKKEERIVNYLKQNPSSNINMIAKTMKLPMEETISVLIEMELKEYIFKIPGSFYTIGSKYIF